MQSLPSRCPKSMPLLSVGGAQSAGGVRVCLIHNLSPPLEGRIATAHSGGAPCIGEWKGGQRTDLLPELPEPIKQRQQGGWSRRELEVSARIRESPARFPGRGKSLGTLLLKDPEF